MQPTQSTIRKRIEYGWERDKAISTPLLYTKRNFAGMHESLDYRTIYNRIHRGREYAKAINTPKYTHGGNRFTLSYTNAEKKSMKT